MARSSRLIVQRLNGATGSRRGRLRGRSSSGARSSLEAVSGVVGIADVLGGTGALLAATALALSSERMMPRLPGDALLASSSKESGVGHRAARSVRGFVAAPLVHPAKPRRASRGDGRARDGGRIRPLCGASSASLPRRSRRTSDSTSGKHGAARVYAKLLHWYAQPALARRAQQPACRRAFPYRIAGALRVYARGLGQVLLPLRLSGDYSAPQEPVPASIIFPESVIGALCVRRAARRRGVVSSSLRAAAIRRSTPQRAAEIGCPPAADPRPIIAVALVWIVVSYFPVSNIPITLPTVRAERFWYFPAIGTSVLLALAFTRAIQWPKAVGRPDLAASPWMLFEAFF